MRFEWDSEKALSNRRKHGITFESAADVFADPHAMIEQDRIEGGEYRWQTIGLAAGVAILVVAHTMHDETDGSEIVRIISARRAERRERYRYEDEKHRALRT